MQLRFIMGAAATVAALSGAGGLAGRQERGWSADFQAEKRDLVSHGTNPWFVLEPGYAMTLEHGDEQLTVLVTNDTRTIDNVETRVVVERETKAGVPTEVSRNFYAISTRTNSVYYFGEEVDVYRNGKVSGHEGSWLAGENGATFGLMMPGLPLLGSRYAQEIAPKVAADRAEIVSVDDAFTVPAGQYIHVLRIAESTPLEPADHETKYYARGVGQLNDGDLKLVRYGMTGAPANQ